MINEPTQSQLKVKVKKRKKWNNEGEHWKIKEKKRVSYNSESESNENIGGEYLKLNNKLVDSFNETKMKDELIRIVAVTRTATCSE